MQRVGRNSGASQQRVLFLYAQCRRPGKVPASQLLTTCFYACFDFRSLSPHSSSPFPCSWAVGPSALTRAEESSGNAPLKTIFRHPRVVFAVVPLSSSVLAPSQRRLDSIPAGASTEGLVKDDAEGRLMNENKILTTLELDSNCPIFRKEPVYLRQVEPANKALKLITLARPVPPNGGCFSTCRWIFLTALGVLRLQD